MNPKIPLSYIALGVCAFSIAAAQNPDAQKFPVQTDEKPSLEAQVEAAKKELTEMLIQYTEMHPRVKEKRREVFQLDKIVRMGIAPESRDPFGSTPQSDHLEVRVVGRVGNPGMLQLKVGSTVWDAVAQAGGFTRAADMSRVILAFRDSKERTRLMHLDLRMQINSVANVPVKDHDSIYVLEREVGFSAIDEKASPPVIEAELTVANEELEELRTAYSPNDPIIIRQLGLISVLKLQLERERPNETPEPTPGSVTPRAVESKSK